MTRLHFLIPNPAGGPVVLLLHGLGADGTSWELQMPALIEAGFRPLAPDMPGFGASPYDGSGWSIRRLAAQTADLLVELHAFPAYIVGLSMGGLIAQQVALDFPTLAKKLVLVSTFAALRPQGWSQWAYFIRRLALALTLGLKAQSHAVAQRIFPDPKDQFLRDLLVASISRADHRAYRKAMFSLGLFDSRKRLQEIKIPTLVITGAEDTTILPIQQKLLSEHIPSAVHVTIQNAGHAVPVDQPDQFNRELIRFLKG